jgi:hypothetical protein
MFEIILANFGFWFNFLVPVAIALFLVITHREYVWKEFGIQVAATLTYVAIIYSLLFSVTTDLIDENYYNGQVKSSTYYEEWTELVHYTESYSCGTSKNPRTCTRQKTRRDYHSPYYQIKTNLGETISISRGEYLRTSREFGKKFVNLNRSGQVSYGDGDKYVSYPTKLIPTSVGHTYENLVAAANGNVIHTKVPKETVQDLIKTGKIREYPSLYSGIYGETLLNRVIDTTGLLINPNVLLNEFNKLATSVGITKQANPILYITKEDSSFKDALSQHWKMGKKNDIILILGVNDEGIIIWSDCICFTNNSDFIVDMQTEFSDKSVNDKTILSEFEKLINNGYVRKPMKEFEYLKENITLEWYWQLLIFIGNLVLSIFITYKFLNNYDRKRN